MQNHTPDVLVIDERQIMHGPSLTEAGLPSQEPEFMPEVRDARHHPLPLALPVSFCFAPLPLALPVSSFRRSTPIALARRHLGFHLADWPLGKQKKLTTATASM